jgi:hypothetical protein
LLILGRLHATSRRNLLRAAGPRLRLVQRRLRRLQIGQRRIQLKLRLLAVRSGGGFVLHHRLVLVTSGEVGCFGGGNGRFCGANLSRAAAFQRHALAADGQPDVGLRRAHQRFVQRQLRLGGISRQQRIIGFGGSNPHFSSGDGRFCRQHACFHQIHIRLRLGQGGFRLPQGNRLLSNVQHVSKLVPFSTKSPGCTATVVTVPLPVKVRLAWARGTICPSAVMVVGVVWLVGVVTAVLLPFSAVGDKNCKYPQ